MKYDCEIIQDLLPLYQDNICSGRSREAVEEHISGCDVCRKMAEQMKYGIIVVSAVPLLCVYPFLQKYFVKGVTVGAVKG